VLRVITLADRKLVEAARETMEAQLRMVFKTPCIPLRFEGVRGGTISAWKNKLNWD